MLPIPGTNYRGENPKKLPCTKNFVMRPIGDQSFFVWRLAASVDLIQVGEYARVVTLPEMPPCAGNRLRQPPENRCRPRIRRPLRSLNPSSSRNAQAAFNLTELLVVLATLMALVLLAVPRFATAGAEDSAAVCLNNHRRLALALTLFANDNGGRLVNNFTVSALLQTAADRSYLNWTHNLLDWNRTANSMNTNLDLVASSKLFPYLENDLLAFKCPADTFLSAAQRQAGWTGRVRSYSMNGFMGQSARALDSSSAQGRNPLYPNYRQFLQLSSIPKPNNTFVFLDEHADSINDGYFLNDPGRATAWTDLPASYHNGGCSVSFADGHAELRLWQYARTRVPVRFSPPTGTTIPPSEAGDYQWLAQRASVDPTTLGATRASGNKLRIIWSALPTNYVLQTTDSLPAGSWTNTGPPPTKSLGQNSVELDVQNQSSFFRLEAK